MSEVRASGTRRTAFRILALVAVLGFGGFGFLSLFLGALGLGGREEHRVHDLAYGAVAGILLTVPLLLQAIRPERMPALMQVAAAGALGFAAGYALGGTLPFGLAAAALLAVLWWLHPVRDQLAGGTRPQPLLLALALLAAIPLAVYAFDQAEIQRACAPADQHCEEFHYAGMAALSFALPLVGVATSFRTSASRIAGWLVGTAAAVLGLSGILFPDLLSSIGRTWGAVALGSGVAFVAVTEWGARATRA